MRIVYLLLSLNLVLGSASGRAHAAGHGGAAPNAASDTLALGSPLQSNMVVQANKPFKVWGWAKPDATVQILADWNSGPVQVQADASGNFMGIVNVPAAKKGD
jgi:hypothetical protein